MTVNLIGQGAWYEATKKALPNAILSDDPVKADILLCVGYSHVLKNKTIRRYKHVLNIHTNLPQYRGRHPIVWAMINGEKEIQVNVHYIQDETIDTGDIVLQDSIVIDANHTYQEVLEKTAELIPRLITTALKQIECGCAYRRKQLEALANYTPRRYPQDSQIPEGLNPEEFTRYVNALSDPMPNAFLTREGKKIYIKQARIE